MKFVAFIKIWTGNVLVGVQYREGMFRHGMFWLESRRAAGGCPFLQQALSHQVAVKVPIFVVAVPSYEISFVKKVLE